MPEPEEWIRRVGTLPLMYQPGERWVYHMGSEVVGVLVARASGQPFDRFLSQRLFEPLGMKDTGLSVPADKLSRLATCYTANPSTGALDVYDGVADSEWGRPVPFPSGGGSLVSTADDYLAFATMLSSVYAVLLAFIVFVGSAALWSRTVPCHCRRRCFPFAPGLHADPESTGSTRQIRTD